MGLFNLITKNKKDSEINKLVKEQLKKESVEKEKSTNSRAGKKPIKLRTEIFKYTIIFLAVFFIFLLLVGTTNKKKKKIEEDSSVKSAEVLSGLEINDSDRIINENQNDIFIDIEENQDISNVSRELEIPQALRQEQITVVESDKKTKEEEIEENKLKPLYFRVSEEKQNNNLSEEDIMINQSINQIDNLEKQIKERMYASNFNKSNDKQVINPKTGEILDNSIINPQTGKIYENIVIDPQTGKILSENNVVSKREQRELLENMQTDTSYVLKTKVNNPISIFQIHQGTVIPIVLVTGINSELQGQILARVLSDVYNSVSGQYLIIPAGSSVIGNYENGVAWGQKRIMIAWNRLIRPDGSSIMLNKMNGVDLQGYSGYSDKIDMHFKEMSALLTVSTVMNLASGQIAYFTDKNSKDESAKGAVKTSASESANDITSVINSMTEKYLSMKPTITIRPGTRANIMVNKDFILSPYQDYNNYRSYR